jgi:hypothetical protein
LGQVSGFARFFSENKNWDKNPTSKFYRLQKLNILVHIFPFASIELDIRHILLDDIFKIIYPDLGHLDAILLFEHTNIIKIPVILNNILDSALVAKPRGPPSAMEVSLAIEAVPAVPLASPGLIKVRQVDIDNLTNLPGINAPGN